MLLAGLVAAMVPWTLRDPSLRAALIHRIAASTGLRVHADGPLSLRLLPTPTLRLKGVSMTADDDMVHVDADRFSGRLDLWALATGRLRLAATILDRPTLVVDLDRLQPKLKAMGQGDPAGALPGLLQARSLVLRDGVIRLVSADPAFDIIVTDLYATWDWPPGMGASLEARGSWRGQSGALAAVVAGPTDALAGQPSPAYLRLRSDALDLTVSGAIAKDRPDLTGGHLIAATHDLPRFLRLVGTPFPALDAVTEARISGDWALPAGLLDLRNARIELDDMVFEGAMAFRQRDGRPGLSGTLATDRIDLAPFLSAVPKPTAPDGSWSSVELQTKALAYDDIDLRISATRADLGPITFEDGGLSLQSGGGRLEFSLGEARSEDGLIKGRVIAQVADDKTEVRAEANLSQINLAALMRQLGLAPLLTGSATGRLSVETGGESLSALVSSAKGEAELSVRDGTARPSMAARLLQHGAQDAPTPDLPPDPMAFDSARLLLKIADGTATVADGQFVRNEATYPVAGTISFRDQAMNCVLERGAQAKGRDPLARLYGPWRRLQLDASPGLAAER